MQKKAFDFDGKEWYNEGRLGTFLLGQTGNSSFTRAGQTVSAF